LLEEIGNIAPEADLSRLDPNADFREELDIDSIGFLNLITALHERLKIAVPESDYSKLATLTEATNYLSGKDGAI
jgi:acyl carrier protein